MRRAPGPRVSAAPRGESEDVHSIHATGPTACNGLVDCGRICRVGVLADANKRPLSILHPSPPPPPELYEAMALASRLKAESESKEKTLVFEDIVTNKIERVELWRELETNEVGMVMVKRRAFSNVTHQVSVKFFDLKGETHVLSQPLVLEAE